MVVSLALLVSLAIGSDIPEGMSGPSEAKSTAEIVAAAEKDDVRGRLRSKAYVSTAEYSGRGVHTFVAWHNPYSGEAACHVYIYVHDDVKGVWVRKVAQIFRNTHDVSVEFGDVVTIRDVKGKAIGHYPEAR